MLHALARNWYVLVIRGVVAILFGVLALIWPGLSIVALVILFGAYAVVDGIFAIGAVVMGGDIENRWSLAFEGIIGLIAGIVAFVWPSITALALLYLIAFWAIITGLLEITAAVRLRREIAHEWALGLAGGASVLFGLIAIVFPGAGALSIIWLIGVYAIIFGVLLIALGLRLRSMNETRHSGLAHSM